MLNSYRLKKKIRLTSDEVINFLKNIGCYIDDNGLSNVVTHASDLDNADESSLNWLAHTDYDISSIRGGIIVVGKGCRFHSTTKSIIQVSNPKLAYVKLLKSFFIDTCLSSEIHSSVSFGNNVVLGENLSIAQNVIIGENVSIGNNAILHPNVVVYDNVSIGCNVVIGPNTSIGYEGFGYIEDVDGKLVQFPHVGRVIICDNVEIAANVCIDRGALSDTVLEEGVKIDNLVHVGHNCTIMSKASLAAGSVIGGSATIGEGSFVGINATVRDGVNIPRGSLVTMGATVVSSCEQIDAVIAGAPARVVAKRCK